MIYSLNHGVKPSALQQIAQQTKQIADRFEYKHAIATVVGIMVIFWILLLVLIIRMGQNPLTFPSQLGDFTHRITHTANSNPVTATSTVSSGTTNDGSSYNFSTTADQTTAPNTALETTMASSQPFGGLGGSEPDPVVDSPVVTIPPVDNPPSDPVVTPPDTDPTTPTVPVDPTDCACTIIGDGTDVLTPIVDQVLSF